MITTQSVPEAGLPAANTTHHSGGSTMTNPIRLIRAHPMLSFTALACLFGWWRYIAAAFGLGSDPGNDPLGPGVAALVVVACQGRASLATWWRRLRTWRASPAWYAVAVLVPLAVHLIIVLINHGLGAPLPTTAQLGQWPDIPLIFVVNLVWIGIGEESGWTAFAAPLLLRRHGLLGAWAILAPIRILWHLPLMLTGDSGWVMGFVGNAAFQLILLQMFRASGQWSLAAVWHATLNTFGGSFFTAMVTGADQARYGLLLTAIYALLAIIGLVLGRNHVRTREAETADEPSHPTSIVTIRA
jgi:membrane protease YdiL (CAAX protease family)